jgi:hypothetical protein
MSSNLKYSEERDKQYGMSSLPQSNKASTLIKTSQIQGSPNNENSNVEAL